MNHCYLAAVERGNRRDSWYLREIGFLWGSAHKLGCGLFCLPRGSLLPSVPPDPVTCIAAGFLACSLHGDSSQTGRWGKTRASLIFSRCRSQISSPEATSCVVWLCLDSGGGENLHLWKHESTIDTLVEFVGVTYEAFLAEAVISR